MRRFAIINQKGGVGKTTTTANLGAVLADAGLRVLLVDLDPQGHLTLHFGAEVGEDQATIYDVLTASTPAKSVAVEVRDRITLLPADIDLAGAEAELVSVTGREVLLREALQEVEPDHDIMLIDCPPSLGVLTINALVAASEVLIPLQAHFFGLQGIGKLLETVTLVKQRINPSLLVRGIALCMHESATRLAGEVTEDLTKFLEAARDGNTAWSDARVYKSTIRRNIKLAESCSFGQTVFDYAPRSNGAADYANLAAEVFGDMAPALRTNRTPVETAESNAVGRKQVGKEVPVSAESAAQTEAVDEAPDAPKDASTVKEGVGEEANMPGADVPAGEHDGTTDALGQSCGGGKSSSEVAVETKPAPRRNNGARKRKTAKKTAPKTPPPAPHSPTESDDRPDRQPEATTAAM